MAAFVVTPLHNRYELRLRLSKSALTSSSIRARCKWRSRPSAPLPSKSSVDVGLIKMSCKGFE